MSSRITLILNMKRTYAFKHLDRLLCLKEFDAPRSSRKLACQDAKVVSLTHQLSLPPREGRWYSFVLRGRVDPRTILRTARLCKTKVSKGLTGIRARDILAANAVPQPTAPSRNPNMEVSILQLSECDMHAINRR
jgi:hypothetical protein